jgi:TPR repeat protein
MKTLPLLLSALLLATPVAVLGQEALGKAEQALAAGKFSDAAALLRPLAQSGDAEAQYRLGMLYYHGQGVAEDERAAVEWWKKSAAQNNVKAMFELGNAFTFGNDTPKLVDDADQEAARWYFHAANAGHVDAMYSLGLIFLAGKGVYKSELEAAKWMQRAARGGHPDASNYAGQLKP